METTPIDPVAALIPEPTIEQVDATNELGRNEFLSLLVAKLENQDPLSPSQDTEFLAELATFSSLEQLLAVNTNLETLALGQAQLVNSQALDLIGREALVANASEIRIQGGVPEALVYSMPTAASTATLTLRNEAGETVKTFELDRTPRGRVTLEWDGTDSAGNPLPDGKYSLRAEATDGDGEPITVDLFQSLPIDGVNFANGLISLISGDVEIPFESIVEFRAGQK